MAIHEIALPFYLFFFFFFVYQSLVSPVVKLFK